MTEEFAAPQLAIDAGKVGRLYRTPGDATDYTGYNRKDFAALVHEGKLFPSITTVLNVMNAPYLIQWAVNMAAEEAVRVGVKWPERFQQEPRKAYSYLRSRHTQDLNQASNRGTRKHYIFETLGKGKSLNLTLDDDDRACIAAWEGFVKAFSPTFRYQELTGFGTTRSGLKVGGTTDFIADIEGMTVAGDYKCSTLDTPILMGDSTYKKASDIRAGDRIVAWSSAKNLHVATVAWTADNGVHPITSLTTQYGQNLRVTGNHPVLVNRHNKLSWVKAEDIQEGDNVHLATGWNHNPHRPSQEWTRRVSSYAVGVIWAILNDSANIDNKRKTIFHVHDGVRKVAKKELQLLGLIDNDADLSNDTPVIIKKKDVVAALNRNNSSKTAMPFPELFESPRIPQEIFGTTVSAQEGFLSGVREVFGVRGKDVTDYTITLSSEEAVDDLQHLYLNLGVTTQREENTETKISNLRVPKINTDELIKHGPLTTKIVKVEKQAEEPTVAIEVDGAHTHVTGGIITHNTTRSGLHNPVSLQLTAFARTHSISPDNIQLLPTPKIDKGIAVHISPAGYKVQPVSISDASWDVFQALREAWYYYAFDGITEPGEPSLKKAVRTPQDLLNS